MPVKLKRVQHIYHDYNLYAATYSRCPSYKMGEALGALFTMHELQRLSPDGFPSFTVLEILAGRSEHYSYMKQFSQGLDIRGYHTLESEGSGTGLKGDVLSYSIDPHLNINFIIGFFFSASSVLDLDERHRSIHARSVVAQLFKNMYANLPDVGAFVLDYANNGYNNALMATKGADSEEFEVPFYHGLRADYGLPPAGKCVVKMTRNSVYDRLTGMNSDHFTKPLHIEYEGEVVGKVTVELPMTQRYFAETELVDMAQDAGFTKIMLLKSDYSENDFEVLSDQIELDDEEEIDDDNMGAHVGNTIVALKGIAQ